MIPTLTTHLSLTMQNAKFTPHAKAWFLGSSQTPCWLCFVEDTFNSFISLFLSLYCWNLACLIFALTSNFILYRSKLHKPLLSSQESMLLCTNPNLHTCFNSCLAFPTYSPLTHFFPFGEFLTILSKCSFLKPAIQVRTSPSAFTELFICALSQHGRR